MLVDAVATSQENTNRALFYFEAILAGGPVRPSRTGRNRIRRARSGSVAVADDHEFGADAAPAHANPAAHQAGEDRSLYSRPEKIALYTRSVSAGPSSDVVAQHLQRAIAERSLVPGDRLGTEAELARELGVSRPAVREAVRLLVGANLVRAARGPGGGVFVAQTPDRSLAQTIAEAIAAMLTTDTTSIAELTEVRLLLEVPLAGLAAKRADAATIAALWQSVEEAASAPDDDDVQRRADIRFHRTIADAAGNRVSSALIAWSSEVLQSRLKDLIAPAIVEAVAREQHEQIAKAIAAHNPSLSERAMRVHLQYLEDLLETVRAPLARATARTGAG
jgi:GntR family transcriptional regulator, transcriptional repressor for pyruvate dehydrogenase complex